MRAWTWLRTGATAFATGAVLASQVGPATAADGGHGYGRMGPASARSTAVNPSTGADFEMPFLCGQSWIGTTRSGHSPSAYAIDWNTTNDLGRPALASAPGVVTRAVSLSGSYGRHVILDHGGGYTSLYAHLNQIVANLGQVVDQGDLLGYVGSSGRSTGPHLHFEERMNGAYFRPYLHRAYYTFRRAQASANCNDRPVVGDWNGDGVSEVGIFRTGTSSSTFYQRSSTGSRTVRWGTPGDVPVVGDFDGDRVSQIGVRKLGAGTWLLRSRNGAVATVKGVGGAADTPLTGDWDGNGRANLGLYRSSNHTFYLRSERGTYSAVALGTVAEQPVTGDWNGDGRTDVGVHNRTTGVFTLRVPARAGVVLQRIRWGTTGDMPVVGDWNGDKISDLGVWRPSTATFYLRRPAATPGRFVTASTAYGYRR